MAPSMKSDDGQRGVRLMLDVRDAADAVLLGLFLFGLLFTVAGLVLGHIGVGVHHGHADNGGPFFVSLGALLVFLTWLGGVAYLLRRAADWPLIAALPAAAIAGFGVAALVQRAVRKLSDPTGSVLDPERYRLPGTIGRVSSSIRPGGTGEVIYEQGGVRHVVAARTSRAEGLPRGTEVVVLSIDQGIAAVDALDSFLDLDDGRDPESLAEGR
jgi:membrane protein implicated in regulation of membrane protease activity